MSLLPIRIYGDPILRKQARAVSEVEDDLRTLASDMVETMRDAEGVGLAANQVGELRRIIVVDHSPLSQKGEAEARAFINPQIVEREGSMRLEEGCLSIPDVREEIERALKVWVRYTDLDGTEQEADYEGFLAAVVQHEIDHLDGILIVDRISPIRRALLKSTLRRIAQAAESAP